MQHHAPLPFSGQFPRGNHAGIPWKWPVNGGKSAEFAIRQPTATTKMTSFRIQGQSDVANLISNRMDWQIHFFCGLVTALTQLTEGRGHFGRDWRQICKWVHLRRCKLSRIKSNSIEIKWNGALPDPGRNVGPKMAAVFFKQIPFSKPNFGKIEYSRNTATRCSPLNWIRLNWFSRF